MSGSTVVANVPGRARLGVLGLVCVLTTWANISAVAHESAAERDAAVHGALDRREPERGFAAFNANRSIYSPNQTAYLQLGVVDRRGSTVCDAELELSIAGPDGVVETLSTLNGRIRNNPECGPDNVIDAPDYSAEFTPRMSGTYQVTLVARTFEQLNRIQDRFEVRERVPFDIERVGPTRIYPVADYPMSFRITASDAYRGRLREHVPAGFDVRDPRLRLKRRGSARYQAIEQSFAIDDSRDGSKVLTWEDIALDAGDALEVTYTFDAPNTSPDFYLLGAAELDGFSEARSWQIAVDATAVFDTFTEVSDTSITSHTPDTGTSWTQVFDNTTGGNIAEVSETTDIFHADHIENSVGQAYTAQPAPSTSDQNVSITLRNLDTTSSDRTTGIFARRTDNANFYHVQLLPNSHASPSVTLNKFEGGTNTVLGTFDATLAVGTIIKLEVRDAVKRVLVDGLERISSADNSLTAAGTWGVYFGDFNGAGIGGDIRGTWHLDDFLAEDGVGATDVYYSVGTSAADLKNGSPTVTITNGVATLTTAQPLNVGVGDELTYNGGTRAYISARTSSTVYSVTTATGLTPLNIGGATVNSITRAFNTLNAAVTGSSDLNHLNTSDLAANNLRLHWSCYDDGPMNDVLSAFSGVHLTGWTTAADNYLRIFSPVSADEVGVSQRHTGVTGTGFRLVPNQPAPGSRFYAIEVNIEHLRIEGVEIDGSSVTGGETLNGINVGSIATAGSDFRFDALIIHHFNNTTVDDFDASYTKGITMQDGNLRLSNSIVYAIHNVSTHPSSSPMGVELNEATATHFIYNVTVFDIKQLAGAGGAEADGIPDWSSRATVRNTFVGDVSSATGPEFCYRLVATQSNNVSSDATAVGVTGQTSYASYFQSTTPGSEDLHLLDSSFNLWGANGSDLSADANLPVRVDIDGEARSRPDIGADEDVATRLYRSVGITATNLNSFPRTVGIAGSTATFSGPMPDNVGVGDVLTYASGGNRLAFIVGRSSSSVFTVADKDGGSPTAVGSGTSVGVYRAYTSLANWESGNENPNIVEPIENDVNPSLDLVSANTLMLVPCYGDGEDTASVDILGWTTGRGNYIKIYTPRTSNEVGTSQRHDGKWNTSAYHISNTAGTDWVIQARVPYFRLDGVQVDYRQPSTGTMDAIHAEDDGTDLPAAEIYISNSIVRMSTPAADRNAHGINALDNYGDVTLDNTPYVARVWNNIVYGFVAVLSGDARGITVDNYGTIYAFNNTIVGRNANSRYAFDGSSVGQNFFFVTNNIAIDIAGANNRYNQVVNGPGSSNNLSDNNDAPGANPVDCPADPVFVNAAARDYHLASGDTCAQDLGADLSADANLAFTMDIDFAGRRTPWDIGADDVLATTQVALVSFSARAGEGAAELSWETGSELNNLGFHLYRSLDEQGPYERITTSVIPGLGSSPEGTSYAFVDEGLTNGVTYYYELEDIETTGTTTRHGPVFAVPEQGALAQDETIEASGSGAVRITYGKPWENEVRLQRSGRSVVLELITAGFYAYPEEDGSVRLEVPGLESVAEPGEPAIPVYRGRVDAVSGRKVVVGRALVDDVDVFASLRPSFAESPAVIALPDGTVRASARKAKRLFRRGRDLYPSTSAQLVSVAFQGTEKKALVELAPLRWDASGGRLLLARRLRVRVSFKGREPSEAYGKRRRPRDSSQVLAQLATREAGIYAVRFEDVFGKRARKRSTSRLRLSRQGEAVAFRVAPNGRTFGPGSVLYFLSEGAAANPYGREAVYELEASSSGVRMEKLRSDPGGVSVSHYWKRVQREENRLYQSALLNASDPWLWDWLLGPMTKSFTFDVTGLTTNGASSRLELWLQGGTDFPESPDHHVRAYVNGTLVADERWDGDSGFHVAADVGPGVLHEGSNVLELEDVGDTDALYSMVFLDRFEVWHPARLETHGGRLEGGFDESGAVWLPRSSKAHVFDVTGEQPKWITRVNRGDRVGFGADSGHQYLVVHADGLLRADVRMVYSTSLRSETNAAEYVVIGPRAFLQAAAPLVELRRGEGLRTRAVAIEDIYADFGHGETTPESVREFLSYAYHHWSEPSLRYVLLLGDATYDPKDYLGTGVDNRVPAKLVKTRYLWTASDPWLAAINGDDLLPDVAIGRLPAASVEELEILVDKILAYESRVVDTEAPAVLVTDNPDAAGNFDANADALAASVLAGRPVDKIYLSQLGTSATREAIMGAFDDGASVMSYVGHGAIRLWASENVFNLNDTESLTPQAQQPLLFTMNCLNGYFHFPYYDSLSERLLKIRDKGVIAAFSPTGLSLDAPAHRFHEALLEEVVNQNHQRLGDAILAGQAAYADTGAFPELLRIYHLLGDPALTLR